MANMNNNSAPRLPPGGRRARTSKVSRNGQPGAQFDGYLSPKRPHAGAYDEMFGPDGGRIARCTNRSPRSMGPI
jgi:hypothetical protein